MTTSSDDDRTVEERAEARVGSTLRGKYRLDAVLGIGGMAAVYRATHRNQAEFAIKLLHTEVSIHPSVRARFIREGYAANSVKHPGVVRVVDDDVDENGQAFLVMDLLDGMGLERLHERAEGRLPPALACAVIIQLLDILQVAHAKHIVHRDLKPANLFVTRDGMLKVLDFGIARARDAAQSSSATGAGVLLGTPSFMPPEQALGKTDVIDARSDLWSVGATLFTLLAGEYVHGNASAMQTVVTAATIPAPSIAILLPDLDAGVVAVIDRALAFRQEDRWPDAAAMRAALVAATRLAFGSVASAATVAGWLEEDSPTQASLLDIGFAERPEPRALPESDIRVSAHPPVESTLPGPDPLQVPVQAPPEPLVRADTTSRPVSSVPSVHRTAPVLPPVSRSSRWIWIAAACSGSIVALMAVGGRWGGGPAATVNAMAIPPPVAASGNESVEPPASTASAPAVAPQEASRPPSALAQSAASALAPQTASSPPVAPPASRGIASRPAPAKSPSAPRPDCHPNFTVDADGAKHFKPECFR